LISVLPIVPVAEIVDLLPFVLADVADVEVVGRTVEREPPGIPHPVRDDPRGRVRAVDVELEDLAEQDVEVLGPVLGVAAGAAVAHPDIEHPVGPELELAAVVVRVGLRNGEQHLGTRRDRARSVRAVLDDPRVAPKIRVVDVEEVVLRVVRVERDRQEPPLAAARDLRAHVQERRLPKVSVLDDADQPGLLDDVDAVGLARRGGHVERSVEACKDLLEVEVSGAARAACRAGQEQHRSRCQERPPTHHDAVTP
jgi:hypothetical protein